MWIVGRPQDLVRPICSASTLRLPSDRVLARAGFAHEGTLKQRAWFKGDYHDFRMLGRVAEDPLD
jgi:hypothetical protein